MNYFVAANLALVFVVGAIASYTDIRHGKIYNKVLAAGAIAGACILAVSFNRSYEPAYLSAVCVNGTVAVLAGFFLWYAKKWSAGDAKLFAFFAWFLPLQYYQKSHAAVFPSVNILINTFIVIVAFAGARCVAFSIGQIIAGRVRIPQRKPDLMPVLGMLQVILGYFLFIFSLSLLPHNRFITPVVSNNLFVFFLIYFFYGPMMRHRRFLAIVSGISAALIVFLVFMHDMNWVRPVTQVTIFVFLTGLMRLASDHYVNALETYWCRVVDLKPGQVLVQKELDKIAALPANRNADIEFNQTRTYGLNAQQIGVLKGLYGADDVLLVYKALHMAPWMLAGLAITVLTSSNLLKFLLP